MYVLHCKRSKDRILFPTAAPLWLVCGQELPNKIKGKKYGKQQKQPLPKAPVLIFKPRRQTLATITQATRACIICLEQENTFPGTQPHDLTQTKADHSQQRQQPTTRVSYWEVHLLTESAHNNQKQQSSNRDS